MALKPGDKCPQCHEGLLVRSELGLSCDECPYELEIEEVVAQMAASKTQVGEYTFKPKTLKITIEVPDDGEEFLRGLILARQNNNSEYFVDLVDAVNEVLQPWRAWVLDQQMRGREVA